MQSGTVCCGAILAAWHIVKQTDKQVGRLAQRQTYGRTDKHTDRRVDRQTSRHPEHKQTSEEKKLTWKALAYLALELSRFSGKRRNVCWPYLTREAISAAQANEWELLSWCSIMWILYISISCCQAICKTNSALLSLEAHIMTAKQHIHIFFLFICTADRRCARLQWLWLYATGKGPPYQNSTPDKGQISSKI